MPTRFAPFVAALCLVLSACDGGDNSTTSVPATQGGSGSASTATGGTDAKTGASTSAVEPDAVADTGTGGEPAAATARGKALKVGFSQIGAESGWRTAETESIRSEAQKRGVDLKFSDAQGKQENQIKALRSFVVQNVDAIILAPKVETGWEPVLREAKRAKIPVILVDRGVSAPEDLYTTLIASDFVNEGRMAADWLAEKTGGKANIAELQGSTGAAPAIDRKKGFAEVIAKHPDMKIVATQDGDFSRSGGKQLMEAFLKAPGGQDINAVYAHNDDMALGAIEAIKEAGKKPGTDILLVSIDGVKGAFEAMVRGELNCTVECNPLLGPAAFDAAEAAVAGKQLPKRTIVQDQVFTQEQAKDLIAGRKY